MLGPSRCWRAVRGLSLVFVVLANCAILHLRVTAAEKEVASSTKTAPATHKQKTIVKVANTNAGEKLEDFCIDSTGRILALLGPIDRNEARMIEGDDDDSVVSGALRIFQGGSKKTKKDAKKETKKFESEVHVYDADGKLVEKWPVGFSGQAINTAPDGTVLVGGDGRVARFDGSGKKLHEGESPQMTYISKNPDEMRERAKDQLESDIASVSEQLKEFEEQLKELKESKKEKKDAKNGRKRNQPADDEDELQPNEQSLKRMVTSYQQHLKSLESQTVDQVLKQVLARAKKIHAISAGDKDVFVTCPAMAGYGYGVWRTDDTFGQAKEIVKSLSGCCGQMDVQCRNGELYVCENSRHRVLRLDREGKEIAHFGKRDREGEGESFGGCCNPMNLCFNKEGDLYVSESNGVVKHFTPEGKYLGIVGVANVQPGCKNSCVGVTADDSRLFYIDIQKSQIIVLTRAESKDVN